MLESIDERWKYRRSVVSKIASFFHPEANGRSNDHDQDHWLLTNVKRSPESLRAAGAIFRPDITWTRRKEGIIKVVHRPDVTNWLTQNSSLPLRLPFFPHTFRTLLAPPPPPKDYPSSFPVDIKILPLTSLDSMSKRYTYINRRNFFFQSIPFDFDQKLTTLLPRPFHTSFQNIFITSRMNRFSRFTQTEALERERGFPSVERVEIGQI